MIKGIKIIKGSIFSDKRGKLWTSWKKNKKFFKSFNHDKFSISKKNVLRGLHYDKKTWKLISCVYGKVFFVVVNSKQASKDYLKTFTTILSEKDNIQILVPPGYANGHLCLSEKCVFHYKLSYKGKYSDVDDQKVIKWNDSRLNINWPLRKNLITSARDK
ncbi:dTDP-4-dehydrorhamnose 3,5-epimerase family protein [Pelagibacteraceae bacterium]|nr:dTDP-4-dehydrorhamnose 3,5-epimerase family protein [Candidatus Pelagibacter sp.]MDC1491258.1 dTDP-4-dehydrorhamnose 3,5-epimerase family protein [Pelagibacteraceae bacterium]